MKKSLIDTKSLVIDSIKSQLEKENIEKILLVLNLHNDIYSVHLKPNDLTKPMNFEIDKKETSMIKRMFVNKIKRKIENVNDYKDIMVSIDTNKEDFELFLNDNQNVVTKFEI